MANRNSLIYLLILRISNLYSNSYSDLQSIFQTNSISILMKIYPPFHHPIHYYSKSIQNFIPSKIIQSKESRIGI